MENIASGGHGNDMVTIGHKHGLPTLPIPSTNNLKHRYDPLVMQVTNLLMRDGKKSVAQRVCFGYFILGGNTLAYRWNLSMLRLSRECRDG